MACTDAGYLYERGLGTMKDAVLAAELYGAAARGLRASCPISRGCVNLGNAYRDGIGVAKDPACRGDLPQCLRTHGREDDEPSRLRLRPPRRLRDQRPRRAAKRRKRPRPHTRRVPAATPSAASNAGAWYVARRLPARPSSSRNRAKATTPKPATPRRALRRGERRPYDPTRSAELFRRACELGFTRACGALSFLSAGVSPAGRAASPPPRSRANPGGEDAAGPAAETAALL
jgi:TPR repeat protein